MAREVFVLASTTGLADKAAADTIIYDKKAVKSNVATVFGEGVTPKVGQIYLSASLSGLTNPTAIACYKVKEIADGNIYLASYSMPTGVIKEGENYYKVSPTTYYKATKLEVADLV